MSLPNYSHKNIDKSPNFLFTNGTEYYSNITARCFWESCGSILYKYTDRKNVSKIYYFWIKSALYPTGLKNNSRDFSQVLYSLVHDGQVCKVIKNNYIDWSYIPYMCPPKYLHWEYNLQLELGEHIHADTPNDFLYASRQDYVVSNSRKFAKKFYLQMGHLLIHLHSISDLLFLYVVWLRDTDWDFAPNHHHVLSNLQYYLEVCYMDYNTDSVRWIY